MTTPPAATPRLELPPILGQIRPRARWTETRLLAVAAAALVVGSLSLHLGLTGRVGLHDPRGLSVYLAALGLAHVAQILSGRRSDEVLLPVVGLLGGISLLLMQRLPQDLVSLRVGCDREDRPMIGRLTPRLTRSLAKVCLQVIQPGAWR